MKQLFTLLAGLISGAVLYNYTHPASSRNIVLRNLREIRDADFKRCALEGATADKYGRMEEKWICQNNQTFFLVRGI